MGLGQDATTMGRYRSKALKDAVRDNLPLYDMADKFGGVRRISGGRTIVEEAKVAQNSTVSWVGETGTVALTDQDIVDAPEFTWNYQLGSAVWPLGEKYRNSGQGKYIDLLAAKYEVLEDSMMNQYHAAMLSNGTGNGGLQMAGLPSLVSTTPTTGTVGTIDRSDSSNAWFRNQFLDTGSGFGTVSSSNIKDFLSKGLNVTVRGGKSAIDAFFLGDTHWEAATKAFEGVQVIENESGSGKLGYEKLIYRGKPLVYGGGINFSGATQQTATRTYGLCFKRGGVNVVFHDKAEFDLLEPEGSHDQAVVSRLMFTMSAMTIGGLAKFNWVGFD